MIVVENCVIARRTYETESDHLHSWIASIFSATPTVKSNCKRVGDFQADSRLSTRFATGASVTQSIQHPGIDEIHIQGDVVDEVKNLLLQHAKPFEKMPPESEGGISEKNVVIDDKAAK